MIMHLFHRTIINISEHQGIHVIGEPLTSLLTYPWNHLNDKDNLFHRLNLGKTLPEHLYKRLAPSNVQQALFLSHFNAQIPI